LASKKIRASDPLFLQAPTGRRYVRSFVFARRIDAPLAQVHPLARALFIFCLSAAQLRSIATAQSDLLGAFIFWLLALALFLGCGISARIARLYFLLTLPTLFSLFLTWTVLNTVPGSVLFRLPVYSGQLVLGISLWLGFWLLIVIGYFLWRRRLLAGILLASLLVLILTHVWSLPAWIFARVSFFHALTITLTDNGLWLAVTKVVGYAGMVLCTISLMISGRDAELIGALRQLRCPQPVIFFLSTVFRAFNLALADYETIRQAQLVRAINARPRSFVRHLRDLAAIAVPMVAMMIRRSSEIGDALLARGFRLGQPNDDFYETMPWRGIDWAVLAISVLLLFFALGVHPTLTTLLQRMM
jgi:energy-coupling factor transporter transmembrane protein EcfT